MFGPRHLRRLDLMLAQLRSMPAGSRVLDAACGLGTLASRLKRRGLVSVGLDGAFAAALHTRRVAGVPAVVGDMARLPFRSGSFAAITCGETLEHLDDDRAAAREIARALRDGGRCVITVPALQMLWSASDDYYEHRRRYSRDQLVDVVRGAGMTVDSATYWGFPVTLIYDVGFLLPMNRRRARQRGVPGMARAGRSTALVQCVRAVLSIDRLFQWIPFGPGLLLVATKRC